MKPNNEQLKDCPCPDGYEILTREWLTARMEIPVDALYRFSRKKSPDSKDGWDNLPPRFDCQLEDVDLDRWEFVAPIGTMERSPTPPPSDPLGVAAVTLSDRFEETLAAIEKSHTCDGEGCEVCEILAEADTKPATPTSEPAEGTPMTDAIRLLLDMTWDHTQPYERFKAAQEGAMNGIESLETALAEAKAQLAEAEASYKDTLHRNAISTRQAIDALTAQLAEKSAENERLAEELKEEHDKFLAADYGSQQFESQLTAAQAQIAAKDGALKIVYEKIDAKIQGKAISGYIRNQFPATEGHLPLHEYFCGLGAALIEINCALSPSCGAELLAGEQKKWRMEGRKEALAILIRSEAETFADKYQASSAVGDTGEYSTYWDSKKLCKLLECDSAQSLTERIESMLWDEKLKTQEMEVTIADLTARNAKLEGDAATSADMLREVEANLISASRALKLLVEPIEWEQRKQRLDKDKFAYVFGYMHGHTPARQALDSAQEGRGA